MSNVIRPAVASVSEADTLLPNSLVLPDEKVRTPHLSSWWLLLAGLFLVWNLGYSPLWTPDEGRYASSSLEMSGLFPHPTVGSNNWVVPHLDTIPRLNKPPLVYWLTALCYRTLGVSEITARLPSALAAVGIMLVVWPVGSRMFGRAAGIMAGLAWATMFLPFALGRTCNTDMLLTFALTLATSGIYFAIEGRSEGRQDGLAAVPWWAASLMAGVGFGLALLAKGPVGIALPLVIGFVYLCVARRWRYVPWLGFVGALLLGVAIGAPWYLAVERQQPGFIKNFVVSENLGRLSGQASYHKPSPLYYYLPVLLVGLLPWTTWFFAAFMTKPEPRIAADTAEIARDQAEHRARLFAWLWIGLIIVFFSISKTKLVSYILPAFPALALLLGATWRTLWGEGAQRARNVAFGGTLAFLGAAFIGVIGMALSDKVITRSEAVSVVWQPLIVLALGIVTITLLLRRRDWFNMGITQFVVAGALCATLMPLARRINAHKEPASVIAWAAPQIPSAGRLIVLDTFEPAAMLYLRQPITFVNFKNTSGLDEKLLRSSPFFPRVSAAQTPQYLARLLKDPRPTWVYISWVSSGLPIAANVPYHVWGYNDTGLLVANRPLEFRQPFDAVLPSRRRKAEDSGVFPHLNQTQPLIGANP